MNVCGERLCIEIPVSVDYNSPPLRDPLEGQGDPCILIDLDDHIIRVIYSLIYYYTTEPLYIFPFDKKRDVVLVDDSMN